MKRLSLILIMTVFFGFSFSGQSIAEKKGSISLKSTAEVEVEEFNEEGVKIVKRVPAAKVIPGTEVVFTTIYTNTGSKNADQAVITNPVPEHMIYKENSAKGEGAEITFSVDGGMTYDLPEKLKIINKNGKEVSALPSDYTHIKWVLKGSIKPLAKGDVSFRAVLK